MAIDDSISDPNSIVSGSSSLQLSGETSAPSAAGEGALMTSAPSAVAAETVVINNEALEQTRSLSQRCSAAAIGE